jgi:RNA polymerase sigma factor (sigma-70 family)
MNANLSQSSQDDDRRWPDLLVVNYPLVEEIVRFVAHRHRLTPDDANELGSLVRYKLVEDNYHVLRSFQHRSSMKTYLTTVVSRVWLDWQIERRGKWRPSVTAKRMGDTAVRLEQLLFRDRLSFSEACETLRQNARVNVSDTQLDRLRGFLRSRTHRIVCGLEEVEHYQDAALNLDPASDRLSMTPAIRRALLRAMEGLPVAERRLLTLRFVKGWTVSRIARQLGLDQKATYRHLARIYRGMRVAIEATLLKTESRTTDGAAMRSSAAN